MRKCQAKMSCPCKKRKQEIKKFKSELRSRDLSDDIIDVLIREGFSRLSHVRGLEVEDLDTFHNLSRAHFVVIRTKIREKWDVPYENESNNESTDSGEAVKESRNKRHPVTKSHEFEKSHHDVPGKPDVNQVSSQAKADDQYEEIYQEDANGINKPKGHKPTNTFPCDPKMKDGGSDRSEDETDVEDFEPSGLLQEHFNCDLAIKFFKKAKYEAMERVLVRVDEQTKSSLGRDRFATKISKGCNDFAELHDCINAELTDVEVTHDLACQQLISLAHSHGDVMKEMHLETNSTTYREWAELGEAVFRQQSTLEYGSYEWQKVIAKTKQLTDFFLSLPTSARNVSKSYILLMLKFICRIWGHRNHIFQEDMHGLLRIATFCLPLCESDLVASPYYCEVKHDMYVHAAITLGCNISNLRLDVGTWYDEFCSLKQTAERFYDEGLNLQKDVRSEGDSENLSRFTKLVELRWNMFASQEQDDPEPHIDIEEHRRLSERYVNQMIQHWNSKSYSEFRQSIIDAEDELKETTFKLQLGSLLSPTYKQMWTMRGSYRQLKTSHSLLENLNSNLLDVVVDCKRFLKNMKIYSNDAMAEWVDIFFALFASSNCICGSPRWTDIITRGQIAVDDMARGVDPNGRTIMQLYLQLIVKLVNEAFEAYGHIIPEDRIGRVRLAVMNITMTKSPLLANKWYSTMRYDTNLCGLRSLAACVLEDDPPGKKAFYELYKGVKETLDGLIVSCRKLKVIFGFKQDKQTLKTLHEDVERKMFPRPASNPNSGGKVIASDPKVSHLVKLAVNGYLEGDFEKMTENLDYAEKEEGSCDVRLGFAGNVSLNFNLILSFSNNIPESSGLRVVEDMTKKNLLYLAEDHQEVMKYMNQNPSIAMVELIDTMFKQTDAMPGTDTWQLLDDQAVAVIRYYESLTRNGRSVTKAYIILFLTVLHNFIATRNRLCGEEHRKLLPFIMPCVIICESKLLIDDEWIKTQFEVYEIIVLTTGSSLGAGQIPCAPLFPKYCQVLDKLKERAQTLECGIDLMDRDKQHHFDNVRKVGLEFYRGSEYRMCITIALLHYHTGCFKGLMHVLNATDKTPAAENIRMNFAMQASSTFEKCVDYHNNISNETTYKSLVENAYFYLRTASIDFSNFVQKMNENTSNDLANWVDEIFQASNGKPNLNPSLELKSVTEKSQMAAASIMRLSKEARCFAQTYLSFFMSLIMNYVTRRRVLFEEDPYNGGLKITLAVIILCRDILVTSNFSIKQKQQSYSVAAAYMTEIHDASKVWTSEMETVVVDLDKCNKLRKEFDEICRRREKARKDWPSKVQYAETRIEHDEKKVRPSVGTKGIGLANVYNDIAQTLPMGTVMGNMMLLTQDELYKYNSILPWNVFSDICLILDRCNDACQDWRALAGQFKVDALIIDNWYERRKENPTKTMLFTFFEENAALSRFNQLKKLKETFTAAKLGYMAQLVDRVMEQTDS